MRWWLSAPAVLLSAIARAGRHGVLFKGGVHLESLGQVDVIAFDKTGTVTIGKPGVTQIWTPPGVDVVRLLCLAATVEQRSEHPLGVPVVAEVRKRGVALSDSPLVIFTATRDLVCMLGLMESGLERAERDCLRRMVLRFLQCSLNSLPQLREAGQYSFADCDRSGIALRSHWRCRSDSSGSDGDYGR